MKQALAYYRVSTDEQAEEGQSIETQKLLCRRWAKDNSYEIVGEYFDEGKSATNLNRPALKELLARCQDDKIIEAVLVQDTDRWARSTLDHLTTKALLKRSGIKLISISQPMLDDSPEGNFIDVVMAGANTLQSQLTGRKTSKVLEQKAQNGYWPGWAPIGYRNVINLKSTSNLDKHTVEPDSESAGLVRRMFQMYASGNFTAKSLQEEITRLGLRNKFGKPIQVSAVIHTLKNHFYYGVVPFKGNLYQGKHKPLVEKRLFDSCQMIMSEHNQFASRKRKHDMLLRGLLYCSDCAGRYWGGPHKNKAYYYYFCKNCRGGTYTIAEVLEKQIEVEFNGLEITHKYAKQVIERAKQIVADNRRLTDSDKVTHQNRKVAIENKMREAEDNLLDKTISKDTFMRLYERLEAELLSVSQSLASLEQDYRLAIKSIEQLMTLAENIGEAYKEADYPLKRTYLALFFQKFLVKDGKIVSSVPSEALKPFLVSEVRVRTKWLRREDSNLQPID